LNIRSANLEDAIKIYELATSNSLSKQKSRKLANGFLVSDFTIEKYEKYILNNRYFFLIEDQDEIRGFLLAFTKEEINPDELVNKKILAYSSYDFVIIKQICVAPGYHHKGYGSVLYSFLMDEVKQNIFAAVVLEPINQASVGFHEKMGFRIAFTIIPEDQIKRVVFFWDNPCNNFYDKDIVLNQYERAITLYIHEDSLNWSKLNNYFYITGGILATSALWPKISNYLSFYKYLMVISFLGLVSSFLFRIALSSGVDYLQARKQAVVDVERILLKLKGVRIVSTHYDEGLKNKQLKKSPTTKVMKNIPFVMLILWTLVFSVATARVILSLI